MGSWYRGPVVDRAPSRLAISWLELLLIGLISSAGIGSLAVAERRISVEMAPEQPSDEAVQLRYDVAGKKAAVAALEREAAATHAQLVERRLDASRRDADVATLTRLYPALVAPRAPDAPPVPEDVAKAFREARLAAGSSADVAVASSQRLAKLEMMIAERSAALSMAQRDASVESLRAGLAFEDRKRKALFRFACWSVPGAALVAPLTVLLAPRPRRPGMVWTVLLGSLGVIGLSLGYQTYQVAGAAMAGAVTVVLLLIMGKLS